MPLGASFLEDVPLVEFIHFVFTYTPGGVTVGDSRLCCCVPCLSSAIISLCLCILSHILHKHFIYFGLAPKAQSSLLPFSVKSAEVVHV